SGSERILLVDDEPQIVDMEKQILERLGYRVTALSSSLEALNTFARQPDQFDLVITDMTMPQLAGDRLARRLWDIRPDLPVILCTGYNEMISEDKATAMGIRKFLLKPVDKDELAVAIRSALNSTPPLYLVPRKRPAALAAS
ncbi:MAG: response regulator, partial [Hyphomicrobiales bacterium]